MCEHKETYGLYARTPKTWRSTKIICGEMIYACLDCGAILEIEKKPKRILKIKPVDKIKPIEKGEFHLLSFLEDGA